MPRRAGPLRIGSGYFGAHCSWVALMQGLAEHTPSHCRAAERAERPGHGLGAAGGRAGDVVGPAVELRRGDGGVLVVGAGRCAVMAILNLTPDSFSDGGHYSESERALARVDELITQGADIIDIGAESTRPGAELLTAEAEWARLRELLTALGRRSLPAVLSLDTRHLAVAERAADVGFRLLNLTFPQHLLRPVQPAAEVALSDGAAPGPGPESAAARLAVLGAFDGLVVMHARGTPATMRQLTDYGPDLCDTVIKELADVVSALTDPKLRGRVIYDPGLGFAKTPAQSLQLLGQLGRLRAGLGGPLLVGASRKSLLGSVTGLPVHERMLPSVVAAVLAAQQGAAIVRVHDVAETRLALQLCHAVSHATEEAGAAAPTSTDLAAARGGP